MAVRTADAEWWRYLAQGSGHMRLGSGAIKGLYDFRSRVGDGKDTNPEKLFGAAHAGCFSMMLALQLTNAGFTVKPIDTTAHVHFEDMTVGGPSTGLISTRKRRSPMSRVLSGVYIHLRAKLR